MSIACIVTMIVFVFVVLAVERLPGHHVDQCGKCDYNMTGLDTTKQCPECGYFGRKFVPPSTRMVLRKNLNAPLLAATMATLVAFLVIAQPLAFRLLIIAYSLDGFAESAARNSLPLREFRSGDDAVMNTLTPLVFYIGFSPLWAVLANRKLAARLWITGLFISFILSVVHGSECLRHITDEPPPPPLTNAAATPKEMPLP